MRVAVLSGKGGAGKTFAAVNLAAAAPKAVYIDCDVEEPNGRLFLKPEAITVRKVSTLLPTFDADKCIGCRKCVEFCRFNALAFLRKKPMVFPEVCHSCGGCALVCPTGAVSETERPIGVVERGTHKQVTAITGVLDLGESSGVPIIGEALKEGFAAGETVIIDCPPGSACPVVESVQQSDFCVLVAEPTAFGLHNLKMVYELVRILKKPCGVFINKMDGRYEPLETFCQQEDLPVLARIPYDPELAAMGAAGRIIAEESPEAGKLFADILDRIGGAAR